MAIQEAADLTDNSLLFFVTKKSARDEDRERGLQASMQRAQFNLQVMHASLWSLLAGTGFLQLSYDPYARNGMGLTKVNWRNPQTVVCDPGCTSDDDWAWVILRNRMGLDEIRRRFQHQGWRVKSSIPTGEQLSAQMGAKPGALGGGLLLPPGPLRSLGGVGGGAGGIDDFAPIVDYLFINDVTREKLKDVTGGEDEQIIPAPKSRMSYPNGRLIVKCQKIILFDGPNPYRRFPVFPIHGNPPIMGFWATPPIRYVYQLQQLAETVVSQTIENIIRTNNVIIIINTASGMNKDMLRGLPGEIIEINNPGGGNPVQIVAPAQLPDQMITYPDNLISRARQLFGFSDARQGQPGQGNISSNLFDAAVSQAQSITRARSRLLAGALQKVGELYFQTMCDLQPDSFFPSTDYTGILKMIPWAAMTISQADDYEVMLDPASVSPISQATLRNFVPLLKNLQMIDNLTGLKWMGVPDAEGIANRLQAQQALDTMQALAQKQQGRQGP